MSIQPFYNNPFQEACYVLSDFGEAYSPGAAIIIDGGAYRAAEEERLRRFIAEKQLRPVAHLLTHGHLDHCFGARFIYEEYGLLPIVPDADIPLYRSLQEQADLFGVPLLHEPLDACIALSDAEVHGITAIATPGHTQGGTCYYFASEGVLFAGDTLFQGGYGRTDLPGGDYATLMCSLRRLALLPADTRVYPGHGYSTSIGAELQAYQ